MVLRNNISKNDGSCNLSGRPPPRNFAFEMGDYRVSVHQNERGRTRYSYFHVAIWCENKKIGYIDLSTIYSDVRSVFSVDTKIDEEYQGIGIAYRAYEGLINQGNFAIHTGNQSAGAVKLWRRFASNKSLRLYFIPCLYSDRLFEGDIYKVGSNKIGRLSGTMYTGKTFNPYKKTGSLLLLRKGSALDKAIAVHIRLRQQTSKMLEILHEHDRVTI